MRRGKMKMGPFRSEFLHTLHARGFIHQCTDEAALDAALKDPPVSAYIGFDCTAPSLHVGSLVQIMMLRWFQHFGHRPIVLLGGGTTKVGDPTGRDEARKLLTDEDIATNKAGIHRSFGRFLKMGDGPTDTMMVDNATWLDKLPYVEFLREIGRHFSINRMLTFESVKLRLEREQPMTFLEFNYMILQAYDFRELALRHDCKLQMGGSDQWGNIVNGVELARRMDSNALYGLTTPLLTLASGAKMGKSAQGAVWINEEMLSPYDYWQYWRNSDDRDVGRFLRLFTELPLDEIARLETLEGAELNEAKKTLANEATAMCHGAEAAAQAAETARRTFEEQQTGSDLPTIDMPTARLADGVPLVKRLVEAGLCASAGEAKRLIRGGGARLNGDPASSEQQTVSAADLDGAGTLKLSAGKKRHAILRAV